ncbi:MAG: creatininase family protein [Chloroflexi bacterium]|nr:creatininase family protein [Chloroflexota bacterium]
MPYPIRLEECTWKDVQSALQEGYDTVVITAGSIEQHGPHLPLVTDARLGEELGVRIAGRLGHAFAAPVIRPGLSAHHMGFPGSLTLSPETFTRILEDYCLSLARHGFRCLVLISSHGGNFAAIEQAAPNIQENLTRQGFAIEVIPYVDMEAFVGGLQDLLVNEYGGTKEEASGHADVVETAMMLAVRPDLVHMDQAAPGWMGDLFEVEEKLFREGMKSLTENGVLGDPRRATVEMGRRALDYQVQQMAAQIRLLINERQSKK